MKCTYNNRHLSNPNNIGVPDTENRDTENLNVHETLKECIKRCTDVPDELVMFLVYRDIQRKNLGKCFQCYKTAI